MKLINSSRRLLRRLHADRAGDMVQKILIIACIALPILIILLTFRNEIKGWFEKESKDVGTKYKE